MITKLFSDGACLGNPGPGGYAALIQCGKKEFIVKGGEPLTTNNRMEMRACLEGLKKFFKLKIPLRKVEVYSDSSLLVKTMGSGWKKKENIDLWNDILSLVSKFEEKGGKISWHWVKGHAGHPENEKCDRLAMAEAKKMQKKTSGKDAPLPSASPFFCQHCGKPVKGKLSKRKQGNLIRADCDLCGRFIKFAKHSKDILERVENPKQTSFFAL